MRSAVLCRVAGEDAYLGCDGGFNIERVYYCDKENKEKMVYHSVALPLICFTTLWALVGGVAPFFVPKGPNRG